MYSGYISCVRIGGNTSDWFEVKKGVHQEAPFSMLLFEIFINPMLEELKTSRFGACIADIPAACPRFADDGALVTLSQYALQKTNRCNCQIQQEMEISILHNKVSSYGFWKVWQ